jgi:hypothetical protein
MNMLKAFKGVSIVSGLLIVALVLGFSIAHGNTGQQKIEGASTVNTETLYGQIRKIYKTVDELIPDSAFIVLGSFKDPERIVPPNTSKPHRDPGRRELTFVVAETIKGDAPAQIQIAQRITPKTNGVGPMAGDALFAADAQYILFLTPALPHEGDFYWITGATQGFLVTTEKVFSRNIVGEIPKELGPTVKEVPIKQFLMDTKASIR